MTIKGDYISRYNLTYPNLTSFKLVLEHARLTDFVCSQCDQSQCECRQVIYLVVKSYII